MKYIQVLLKHDDVKQVCWLPTKDYKLRPGMKILLKGDDTVWTITIVWPTIIETKDINRGWHVGGL